MNFGKYHFLLFTVATPLKFAYAYPEGRVGGTGGSGFAVGALASPSFGDFIE